jgi:sphingolipid delta-4 desaturase
MTDSATAAKIHTPRPLLNPDGTDAYAFVDQAEPHPARAREIMTNHPEVRALIGVNRWSGVLLVTVVAIQLAIGYLQTSVAIWQRLLLAYFVGAYLNHTLWVLVHECTHNLISRKRWVNRVGALIANLPLVIPATASFASYHIKHHKYLGDTGHDGDLSARWEWKLFSLGFPGRLTWQLIFPFVQTARTFLVDANNRPSSWTKWILPNLLTQIAFCVTWYLLFGRQGLGYFLLSLYFSVGPHPLGARWIQEHFVFREGQETYSYYGMLNVPELNVGYHNEHHDFPGVPWSRLPALKRLAPEMYDHLYYHPSWTWLWLRFLFDRKLSMTRITREDPPVRETVERPR